MTVLPDAIRGAAERFGDLAAFVTPDGWPLSYRDLDRLSDEAAAGLARRGIGVGDVVVLSMPSTIDYVVAYAAAAKVGAVTAGVNPSLAVAERERLLDVAVPKVILATESLAIGDAEVVAEAASVDSILRELRVDGGTPPPLRDDPDRPVAIVFTSGTTGIPKGATFCDKHLAAIVEFDTGGRWGGGAPQLSSTQLPHVGFMTKLPWYLRTGSTTLLMRRWRASTVLKLVNEYRMATIAAVAPQVALMLRDPDFDSYDFSCVKMIIAGAAPSPPGLVREARERFGCAYSIRYSSTESGGLGTLTAPDAPDEETLFTVGRVRPGIDMELRDENDDVVAPGETGEVCFRSTAMMDGYWRDPEATAVTLRGGWLHTGDLGMIDDIGCLRLVGRSKEMFIRGGYNVFPLEVEAVLSSHPSVDEVAIVPRPDPVMGEIGVAVVVPRDPSAPPTLDDLRAYGGDRLAHWKLPEAVRYVDALPLTSMSKLDRRALAAEEAG